MLNEQHVETITEVKLEAVSKKGVVVSDKKSNKIELPCDTIVISLGVEPRSDVAEAFEGLASEVYIIGDCNNQRGTLLKAVAEGFFAGWRLI
jgi:pyruvate/2-oxoglutarate dehydrogenase complex dihydrolipoamide dehydrogenase (E3) component